MWKWQSAKALKRRLKEDMNNMKQIRQPVCVRSCLTKGRCPGGWYWSQRRWGRPETRRLWGRLWQGRSYSQCIQLPPKTQLVQSCLEIQTPVRWLHRVLKIQKYVPSHRMASGTQHPPSSWEVQHQTNVWAYLLENCFISWQKPGLHSWWKSSYLRKTIILF